MGMMVSGHARLLRGRRVLVTGHTGFKGSWLCLWLQQLGAEVHGYSLPPPTSPSMFELCEVDTGLNHCIGDVRDLNGMSRFFLSVRPEVVLHLAAQPLVRRSYADPLETVTTNILGTAHVLEAVRQLQSACAVVVVSSDKCYENREWVWGYRENDPMGGKDPYSMSKGATELVVSSWRQSFFGHEGKVKLASARAGNVIGGGDWACDRIVPDCIRAFAQGQAVHLRNPSATRPWQHVLEPLGGYLELAGRLISGDGAAYCSGWNFGPHAHDVRPVQDVVSRIAEHWGGACRWEVTPSPQMSEASLLALNCDKAQHGLGWQPTWSLEQAVGHTVDWYRTWHERPAALRELSMNQISSFEADMLARRQPSAGV